MQTITTKYHGPANVRGSRYIATANCARTRVICSADDRLNSDENHAAVAKKLMEKMGWTGTMVGGGLGNGEMVWSFIGKYSPRICRRAR